ncbi:ROK family protein [Acidobacteriota bacterium]
MELCAGFDIGGTQLKYGLVNTNGSVILDDSVDTPQRAEDLFPLFKKLLENLSEPHRQSLQAIGFGFPGIFNQQEQKIVQSPNYPSLDGKDLVPLLAPFIDKPFFINNDANLAAYGEYCVGAGKGTQSLVLLTIGTGVGSGIILNGQIWQGACGFAGELGHSCVNPDGDRCECGSRGCLETEVSAPKIVSLYRTFSLSKKDLSSEDVFLVAKKGDKAGLKAFAQAGYYLGIGLSQAINLLNPEKILLGGGVMESADYLLPPALEEAKNRSYTASFECCCIERTQLGNKAGFIGAALWARDNLKTPN